MSRARVRALIFAGAIAVALAPAGCSARVGPVTMGGPDSSEVCLGAARTHPMLWGDFIRVPEGTDVTISEVDLVDADGIEVKDAWLAPPLDGALGASEFPPVTSPSWDARVAATGAEADEGYNNVILLIERTGREQGTATAMRVAYSADGWNYVVQGSMGVVMKDDCVDG